MEKIIIVSDFDGTITTEDSLYGFFEEYATDKWTEIEQLWVENKISSKECLLRELELVPNLSEALIDEFTSRIELDSRFKEFIENIKSCGLDFVVVSDGIDYFINKILENHGVKNIKIISNHAKFKNGKFELTFPNDYKGCKNDAGTCKCKVVSDLRKTYDRIIYIGDGVSDYCVSGRADILYAKKSLLNHCMEHGIKNLPFENFGDILKSLSEQNLCPENNSVGVF